MIFEDVVVDLNVYDGPEIESVQGGQRFSDSRNSRLTFAFFQLVQLLVFRELFPSWRLIFGCQGK